MKKIVVAGGGLVGSLVAIMMKRRGYEVTLSGKRPDIRQGGPASKGERPVDQSGIFHGVARTREKKQQSCCKMFCL